MSDLRDPRVVASGPKPNAPLSRSLGVAVQVPMPRLPFNRIKTLPPARSDMV